jgi:hypothetical protein
MSVLRMSLVTISLAFVGFLAGVMKFKSGCSSRIFHRWRMCIFSRTDSFLTSWANCDLILISKALVDPSA